MERINDVLGYENLKIFQDDNYFSFSLDSVMLANFASIRLSDKNILDIGTGNAIIPLILSLRTDKNIVGVEIQNKLVEMALKSVKYNNLENRITIINDDIKNYAKLNNNKYDLVICNPPFFKNLDKNMKNLSEEKAIARHEIKLNLSELMKCVKVLLKSNGNFVMVHRTERLIEILEEFRKNNIEPKRIQFVYENINKDSTLVLIEGQFNGKTGLIIDKPFILYNLDGSITDEYNRLITEVRKWFKKVMMIALVYI